MTAIIRVITLTEKCDASQKADLMEALAQAGAASGAIETMVESTLEGGRQAGDILQRLRFDDAGGFEAAAGMLENVGLSARLGEQIALIDGAAYRAICSGGASPDGGLFRTALFSAVRKPTALRLAKFEAETIAMAAQVRSIRSWSLGMVQRAIGRFAWTYVWEQTYDDLTGLLGPYMQHPSHWGHVDRWFDPENPEWLIDPGLVHAFSLSAALPVLERVR